jgi:hypothetical protein
MAKTVQVDDKVVYYAEGEPYTGPFPARVVAVHPVAQEKKSEPQKVDLKVFFQGLDGKSHTKTNVPYALDPTKHHWGDIPADWIWPEPEAKAE